MRDAGHASVTVVVISVTFSCDIMNDRAVRILHRALDMTV